MHMPVTSTHPARILHGNHTTFHGNEEPGIGGGGERERLRLTLSEWLEQNHDRSLNRQTQDHTLFQLSKIRIIKDAQR